MSEEIEKLKQQVELLQGSINYLSEENQKLKSILLAINVLTGK